jgi:hypothetical protein
LLVFGSLALQVFSGIGWSVARRGGIGWGVTGSQYKIIFPSFYFL